MKYGQEEKTSVRRHDPEKESKINSKSVSKNIGEYIDYEELDK